MGMVDDVLSHNLDSLFGCCVLPPKTDAAVVVVVIGVVDIVGWMDIVVVDMVEVGVIIVGADIPDGGGDMNGFVGVLVVVVGTILVS